MMSTRIWLSALVLGSLGCALPPELKEAGDRFVYAFDQEADSNSQDLMGSEVNSSDGSAQTLAQRQSMMNEESAPVVDMHMSASEAKVETAPPSYSSAVSLDELDHRIESSKLPSIFQVSPKTAPEKEPMQSAPAYKVIKVGQEEIRVLDGDMGSVEKTDLQKLRTQKNK
jgi:hypothetical protein